MNQLFLLMAMFSSTKHYSAEQCFQLFDKQKYSSVIQNCSTIKNSLKKLKMALDLSNFFLKVPYQRLNEIFHLGFEGQELYEIVSKKKLLTYQEQSILFNYYSTIKDYQSLDEPLVYLLSAKLFYINEYILKQNQYSSFDESKFLKKKRVEYLDNLENYIKKVPNDSEALFLLGKEGIQLVTLLLDTKKNYYKVLDKHLYSYLVKANHLNYPMAKKYVKGVEDYNKALLRLKNEANSNNPDALYEMGEIAYINYKTENKESLNQAITYFTKAAKMNHLESIKALSDIYENELHDYDKLLELQLKLAKLGDVDALISLGDYYFCNKKINLAKKLYEKAEKLNHPLASIALEDLKYNGEPSQGCIIIKK